MKYRIGVDVGQRSAGFAAVEYDDTDMPIRILCAVSHIHDGGESSGGGATPQSRRAEAGEKRRTRRRMRQRSRRLKKLDEVLRTHGLPVPDDHEPQQYEAWNARARLATENVSDASEEQQNLLSLAVRHIARHRGWRNPWWAYETLARAEAPTVQFTKNLTRATERFGSLVSGAVTIGQIVSSVAGMPTEPDSGGSARYLRIRPTTLESRKQPGGSVITEQVQQVDSFHELKLIFQTQGRSNSEFDAIARAVFDSVEPTIPVKRIGPCALQPPVDPERPNPENIRAPRASLEFQEYRIRDTIANLRVRINDGRQRELSSAEYDRALQFLTTWDDADLPSWRDLAEHLGITQSQLVTTDVRESGTSRPPVDLTSVRILHSGSRILRDWWQSANGTSRSELISLMTDLARLDPEIEDETVRHVLSELGSTGSTEPIRRLLETGRASYSRDTLGKLNEEMAKHRFNSRYAAVSAFDKPRDWQPPLPRFEDEIEHPVVHRVNTLTRRFIMTCITKWGVPDRVVVEHTRDAFAGNEIKQMLRDVNEANRKRNLTIEDQLKASNVPSPRRADVQKYLQLQRQGCTCVYCGEKIDFAHCELDHIIPRSRGGGNKRENLVATCVSCNRAKGDDSFADFATRSDPAKVSLEAALARVKAWDPMHRETKRRVQRLQKAVSNRLAMSRGDDIDERSPASTAYAAIQMRLRIAEYLQRISGDTATSAADRVHVYSGGITRTARRAGGIDKRIQLRGFDDKSRFDRRHHAIDAAVLTSLDSDVAFALRERELRRRESDILGEDTGWRTFHGVNSTQTSAYSQWLSRIDALAALIRIAITEDAIPVSRPLRLTPRVGGMHEETVVSLNRLPLDGAFSPAQIRQVSDARVRTSLSSLAKDRGLTSDNSRPSKLGMDSRHVVTLTPKMISDAFDEDEIQRIADSRLYVELVKLAASGSLAPDPTRGELLGHRSDLEVKLFPRATPSIEVRRGAVGIGDSVHHSRVVAWKERGEFVYGLVRVFAGEFPLIGFDRSTDVFTAPLPSHSQAMRCAHPPIRKRVMSGEAREVGWIVSDDEVQIDPSEFMSQKSQLSKFLKVMPESHWIITGFKSEVQFGIAPSYLAQEGIDANAPEIVRLVLENNRIQLSPNVILKSRGATIIRRTVTGAPRWRADSGLPISWNVREAAERAFAE